MKTRFDLEGNIKDFVKDLSKKGSLSPEDLMETTDYLYNSVEDYMAKGLNEEEAFVISQYKYGDVADVQDEYAKVNGNQKVTRVLSVTLGVLSMFYFIAALSYLSGSIVWSAVLHFTEFSPSQYAIFIESLVFLALIGYFMRNWILRVTQKWYSSLLFGLLYIISRLTLVVMTPLLNTGFLESHTFGNTITIQTMMTVLFVMGAAVYVSVSTYRDKRTLNRVKA